MKTAGQVLIALLVIGVLISLAVLFNGSRPVGSENLVGKPLPDFAAPLAGSGIEGDTNIFTPALAKANDATAACDVELKGTINSCDGLKNDAVLLFWNSRKSECIEQVDRLQQLVFARPRVNAIALAFEDEIEAVTEVTEQRGWRLPVAVDRDGAVSSLYAVTGCPSVFYARDGVVTGVKLGLQTTAQMKAEIGK